MTISESCPVVHHSAQGSTTCIFAVGLKQLHLTIESFITVTLTITLMWVCLHVYLHVSLYVFVHTCPFSDTTQVLAAAQLVSGIKHKLPARCLLPQLFRNTLKIPYHAT